MSSTTPLSAKELVELSIADYEFYGRTFFPRTFRQRSPLFHQDAMTLMEDRDHRQVALAVFRGGAKTSLLRVYTSRRLAFGISRLVAFVGASQDHAKNSLHWLRRHIEHNTQWCQIFGLEKGKVWSDERLEIINTTFGHTVTVLAVGITGQIRGINIDDDRPDLVVLDDPCNEELTATPEQRQKTEQLVVGALLKGLAPRSDNPDAKMVLLQTPLHKEDLLATCLADQSWASRVVGCFNDKDESVWEERFPTAELLAEKESHIKRGQASLWTREMECRVVAPEETAFRPDWLKYWDTLPERMAVYMAIDPVPPPSERQIAMGLHKKDYEAFVVVGRAGPHFYLLDTARFRGHTPEWTSATFFRLLDKWRPIKVVVESVLYQRTLKWFLEQEMAKRMRFVQLDAAPDDKRKKEHRIIQAFSGIASQGRFYTNKAFTEFNAQFAEYPHTSYDDLIDAGAMAITAASENAFLAGEVDVESEDEEWAPPLEKWRVAP